MVEDRQLLSQPQLLRDRHVHCRPPGTLLSGEQAATAWWDEGVLMEHTAQPVACARALLDQAPSVGHQHPQLTHLLGWHPDRRDASRGEQACQVHRSTGSRFHARCHDQLDQVGMRTRDRRDEWLELIRALPGIELPGIRRRF
jgi:hypothetical protein